MDQHAAAVVAAHPLQHATEGQQSAYLHALASEVRMLVDYVSASTKRTLRDLEMPDPAAPGGAPMPIGDALTRIERMERRLADREPPVVGDFALVQVVRDALSEIVRPASGLTIAYTAMVTGNRRGPRSDERATMAERAYRGLAQRARWHRFWHTCVMVMTLLVTGFVAWESAKVAFGKSLLQTLDTLRGQQASLYAEKQRLEAAMDKPDLSVETIISGVAGGGDLPLSLFPLCDRPGLLIGQMRARNGAFAPPSDGGSQVLRPYTHPQARDVCERDSVLAANLGIAHANLRRYQEDWSQMVGSVFSLSGLAHDAVFLMRSSLGGGGGGVPSASAADKAMSDKTTSDIELQVAPTLLVLGNYLLPVLFSLLGAAIFVILDHYGKVQTSQLHPKDRMLSPVRLVLGLVTGACVGLFFSSYGPAAAGASTITGMAGAAGPGPLIASLSLTASGVAFLAGFGVEGVFRMLETLVSRVFSVEAAPQPSSTR